MGTLFVACGVVPLLIGVGVLTPAPSADTPPGWVPAAVGAMFILAGIAIVLDYGIARGLEPDGDFPPGTPLPIRAGNLLLGLAIVGLMTSVFAWVAFGSGPRSFSSTMAVPFMAVRNPRAGEMSGRIAFGVAAGLMALMFVACGVIGIRRFMRAWRGR